MAGLRRDTAFGVDASLSQTGDIPSDARSIQFLESFAHSTPRITLDGMVLTTVKLSLDNQLRAHWAADVTNFAGQTGELRFSTGAGSFTTAFAIDAISFSSQPIPEPKAYLGLLAIVFVVLTRRRQDRITPAPTAKTELAGSGITPTLNSVALPIATVCGLGYIPVASGTFGSAAGLALWWLLC
jgi:hypothetical protein